MTYTETIEERGGYRVRIEQDESPHEPDHYAGCPVLRVEEGDVTYTGYGSGSYGGDGITHSAAEALQKFVTEFGQSDGISTFERYIAIFHGGKTVRKSGRGWREPDYIAYTTERMAREVWGQSEPLLLDADIEEWSAYVEGEVYGVIIEEKQTMVTERLTLQGDLLGRDESEHWHEFESCWGYYGEKYATEAAKETLDYHAGHSAA